MNDNPERPKTEMIFVYGSLLRGEYNEYYAPVLKRFPAVLAEPAILYSFIAYPALVMGEGGKPIRGEALLIDAAHLGEFDRLEGYDEDSEGSRNLYMRSKVMVRTPLRRDPIPMHVYHMDKDAVIKYGGTKTTLDDWRYRYVCTD